MTHQEALHRLQKGNRRFVSGTSIHPRCDEERRREVRLNGQQPMATILACSDSRVPVEHVFDKGLGDLFVLRIAGNIVGSTQIASVEFGLDVLDIPLIVVLGHDDCGAIKGAYDRVPVTGHLLRLMRQIYPTVETIRNEYPNGSPEEHIPRIIVENVFQSIEGLITGSNMIEEALRQKRVRIVGAVFDIASGKVTWLGDHPDQSSFARSRNRRRNDSERRKQQEEDLLD